MDRHGFKDYQETTSDSLNDTKTFVASVLNMKSHLVEPIITPRFVPCCSRELMNFSELTLSRFVVKLAYDLLETISILCLLCIVLPCFSIR